MPESSNVARRYAAGIFQLAQEENGIDTWRAELAKLDELLQDDVLVAAFKNPAVGVRRRMDLAQLLKPELRPETENLLRLLVEHYRTREIHRIREEFERLADEASGIVHATVTTALELEEDDRRHYEQELARKLGRKVNVKFLSDPAIVGGAAIQIGDHLVDGTVRTQLKRLRQELLS
ncbi:MAG TPA: F0F1 ATP synthase subunit delta [Candidatus Dormibacteraeota bacterium]|nr:F0F1 ATP synthase subunit delta [Candidatus Dormibacteraeota bacterium]